MDAKSQINNFFFTRSGDFDSAWHRQNNILPRKTSILVSLYHIRRVRPATLGSVILRQYRYLVGSFARVVLLTTAFTYDLSFRVALCSIVAFKRPGRAGATGPANGSLAEPTCTGWKALLIRRHRPSSHRPPR